MEIKLTNAQAATLGQLFGEVAMFASTELQRPILTGVLFTSDAGKLRMVATDSYALGILTSATIDAPAGFRSLVTAAELATIGKALAKLKPAHYSDDQPRVTLTFGERELIAECDAWRLTARVIEGDFPNYEQLLPVGDGNADSWPAFAVFYVALFAKVRCAQAGVVKRGTTGKPALRFETFGALKPARITQNSEHATFVGLLMPVRVS